MEGRKEQGRLDLFYRGKDGNQLLHAHTRMVFNQGAGWNPYCRCGVIPRFKGVQTHGKDPSQQGFVEWGYWQST